MACHQHRPYQPDEIQVADREPSTRLLQAPTSPRPMTRKNFPAAATDDPRFHLRSKLAMANFGPNLSNIAAKFQSKPQGLKWLANWINAPEKYHPKSLMPNLQLSFEDAADIASWIFSVPGEWPVTVEVPGADSKDVEGAVDELVTLYVTKSGSFKHADGKVVTGPLSEVEDFVQEAGDVEKLLYLGERTISRLGCFGCHTHPRLRERQADRHGAQRLGPQEPGPARLRPHPRVPGGAGRPDDARTTRDGTPPTIRKRSPTRRGWASCSRSSTGRAATTT